MAPAPGGWGGWGLQWGWTAEVPLGQHPWTTQPSAAAGSFGNGLSTREQSLIYHSGFVHCLQLVV